MTAPNRSRDEYVPVAFKTYLDVSCESLTARAVEESA